MEGVLRKRSEYSPKRQPADRTTLDKRMKPDPAGTIAAGHPERCHCRPRCDRHEGLIPEGMDVPQMEGSQGMDQGPYRG